MRTDVFIAPCLAFVLTLLVQLPFFDLWFSFMDEGHMLQFADIARKGGEFYRDATFYPLPGAFHFLSVVFDLFGPSIRISRWVVTLEFAIFVALVFVVLRRATSSSSWAWLGVFCMWLYRVWSFPHWQMYSYSTTSLLILLMSIWVLLVYLEKRDLWILVVSGFLYGLGVLCKQDYGAAAGLAIVLTLWVFLATERLEARSSVLKSVLAFLLPAAAVGAVTGLYYWQAGVLEDLLRFTVFNHFEGMGVYEYTEFPDLFPIFGRDAGNRSMYSVVNHLPAIIFTTDWQQARSHFLFTDTGFYDALIKLYFYGPQLLLMGSALKLWFRRARFSDEGDPILRQRSFAEFVIFAFGSTRILLVWLNRPQDYVHLAVLYWPLILLAVIHAHDLLSGHRRRKWIALAVVIVPALALVGYSGRLLHRFHSAHNTYLAEERAGVFVKPEEALMLEEVVTHMRENSEPDEAVAVLPYFPMAHFLAERMGPHRSSYIVWPFPEIPDRDQAVVDAMEDKQVDLVIYNFTQFYSFDPVWEHAPVLFDYLVDNFELERVFSTMTWVQPPAALRREKSEDLPSGVPLITADIQSLPLWIEEPGSPPRPIPPDVRSVYLEERAWPFRHVMAIRSSSEGRKTVLSVPVDIPETGARLETAIAVHPQWWSRIPPTWIEFELRLRAGDEVVDLHRQRLKPSARFEDRAWFEIDVDLSPWAGQPVVLEFVNQAESAHGETRWMAGWETPRLLPARGRAESIPPPSGKTL
ncbi:MAG: hypothetical protein VX252_07605 [Myxococcota bacterium]|nr:hypothetical protein [Myxococcota bacterium]